MQLLQNLGAVLISCAADEDGSAREPQRFLRCEVAIQKRMLTDCER